MADEKSKSLPDTVTAAITEATYAQQRRINIIWETTQAVIAVGVTGATLFAATSLTLRGNAGDAAFLLLSNAFFLVIGFYFGRTNHDRRLGGVDPTRR